MFLSLAPLRKHRDYRFLYTATRFAVRQHDHLRRRAVSGIRVDAFELSLSECLAQRNSFRYCYSHCGAARTPMRMDRRKLLMVSEIVMAVGSLALAINGMLVASQRYADLRGGRDDVRLQWFSSTGAGCNDAAPGRSRRSDRRFGAEFLPLFNQFHWRARAGRSLHGGARISADLHDRCDQLSHFSRFFGCNPKDAAERSSRPRPGSRALSKV